MRRRHGRPSLRAGLLAVLVLLSSAASGHAGPLDPPRELLVTGSGTKMTTFTLRSEISYWRDEVTISLKDGATYGGAVIVSPAGWRFQDGAYRVTALEPLSLPEPSPVRAGHPKRMGPGGRRVTLAPGTYRVYLFGDGTTEYRAPLLTGTALTLRPSRPARSSLHVQQQLLPADLDPDHDRTVLTHWFSRPNAAITRVEGMLAGPGLTTEATVHVCTDRKPNCTHGVFLGPADVWLTGALTAGTGLAPDHPYKTNGRYQALAEFRSDRSAATTIVLAVVQVEY